jgi:hypothetical protein
MTTIEMGFPVTYIYIYIYVCICIYMLLVYEARQGGALRPVTHFTSQFTCFTGTKVQVLTQLLRQAGESVGSHVGTEGGGGRKSALSSTGLYVCMYIYK